MSCGTAGIVVTPMSETKNLTIRLNVDTFLLLESAAQVMNMSVSAVIRESIENHLDILARNQEFVTTLAALHRRTMDLVGNRQVPEGRLQEKATD